MSNQKRNPPSPKSPSSVARIPSQRSVNREDSDHLLDRSAEIAIWEHDRPHWSQSGTITFITMRLADSIPREVIERWDRERLEYLTKVLRQCSSDWRLERERLSHADRLAFDKRFKRLREDELDRCLGQCVLRDKVNRQIVVDALKFFDNDRYRLGDFVVMPNHVHLLAVFVDSCTIRKQCHSWMRFTACEINRRMGRSGSLWQAEPFDHLVRSESQLRYLRDYIKRNPINANLNEGEYTYCRSPRNY